MQLLTRMRNHSTGPRAHRLAVAPVLLLVATWAAEAAGIEDDVKCQALKSREATKYVFCRGKAIQKGLKKQEAPDFTNCDEKFDKKWAKFESKFASACPTTDDGESIKATGTAAADLLAAALAPSPGSTSILFTEYLEGSMLNKALEIGNRGAGSVDLSACEINTYSNGASTPTTSVALVGNLDSGATSHKPRQGHPGGEPQQHHQQPWRRPKEAGEQDEEEDNRKGEHGIDAPHEQAVADRAEAGGRQADCKPHAQRQSGGEQGDGDGDATTHQHEPKEISAVGVAAEPESEPGGVGNSGKLHLSPA